MKFRVTMKDPDTLHDAISDAVRETLKNMDLEEDEKDSLLELRKEKEYEKASRWFVYGEYLTVEIDTNENTCIVIKEGQ